jgi:hypothetical protein
MYVPVPGCFEKRWYCAAGGFEVLLTGRFKLQIIAWGFNTRT